MTSTSLEKVFQKVFIWLGILGVITFLCLGLNILWIKQEQERKEQHQVLHEIGSELYQLRLSGNLFLKDESIDRRLQFQQKIQSCAVLLQDPSKYKNNSRDGETVPSHSLFGNGSKSLAESVPFISLVNGLQEYAHLFAEISSERAILDHGILELKSNLKKLNLLLQDLQKDLYLREYQGEFIDLVFWESIDQCVNLLFEARTALEAISNVPDTLAIKKLSDFFQCDIFKQTLSLLSKLQQSDNLFHHFQQAFVFHLKTCPEVLGKINEKSRRLTELMQQFNEKSRFIFFCFQEIYKVMEQQQHRASKKWGGVRLVLFCLMLGLFFYGGLKILRLKKLLKKLELFLEQRSDHLSADWSSLFPEGSFLNLWHKVKALFTHIEEEQIRLKQYLDLSANKEKRLLQKSQKQENFFKQVQTEYGRFEQEFSSFCMSQSSTIEKGNYLFQEFYKLAQKKEVPTVDLSKMKIAEALKEEIKQRLYSLSTLLQQHTEFFVKTELSTQALLEIQSKWALFRINFSGHISPANAMNGHQEIWKKELETLSMQIQVLTEDQKEQHIFFKKHLEQLNELNSCFSQYLFQLFAHIERSDQFIRTQSQFLAEKMEFFRKISQKMEDYQKMLISDSSLLQSCQQILNALPYKNQ